MAPEDHTTTDLDLSSCPPIFILSTHLQTDDLHEAEDAVFHAGGQLTYEAPEARVFLGRVSQAQRAAFDLRAKGVWTEQVLVAAKSDTKAGPGGRKRRKLSHEPSSSKHVSQRHSSSSSDSESSSSDGDDPVAITWPDLRDRVLVLKLDWLDACKKQNQVVAYQPFVVYTGKLIPKPASQTPPKPLAGTITYIKATPDSTATSNSALSTAAQTDGPIPTSHSTPPPRRPFSSAYSRRSPTTHFHRSPPTLHRTTTSEHDSHLTNASPPLPPPPPWVTANTTYSCLRDTPANPPNAAFIAQLEIVKESRVLTLDAIGVRAYSTAIAAVAAYPHRLTSTAELLRLPGCDAKIATLWSEWLASYPDLSDPSSSPSSSSLTPNDPADDPHRTIPIVLTLQSSPDLAHLRRFHAIHGVGADTARKFFYTHGWRDIDDVVEFGWSSLTRAQQIGVKFYDDFQLGIPRAEVEQIAAVVRRHANAVRAASCEGDGTGGKVECIIVGGYRRGKAESGDVDVILSHRDEAATAGLVGDVVRSLEGEGWVTHTLSLHTTGSERGQATLPFRHRPEGVRGVGAYGFDSLDKALCVWRDPGPASELESVEGGGVERNTNVHRRVDIIVSPWRTVGCAVLGWSGGNTFQRDIRRWVNKEKGWKFDSSGVRDRGNGMVVDLESPRDGDEGDGWLDRERRLMEGMGIGWRDPSLRCTG